MTITLRGLKVWDGFKSLDANTLVIEGARIAGLVDGRDQRVRDQSASIDCSGLTAIPGLIDAHVHLELNPDDKDAPAQSKDDIVPLMAERAMKMAKAGITTARDLGGGAWHELALRDAIACGDAVGPRLLCSGQPITSPRGHCHFWGGEAASLDEAKSVLTRQLDHGVDLIKIMATGGRLTKGSEPTDAQFSQETLSALVAMAHASTRHVAAHCHGTEGIRRAANAGVDTIEHCSWVGPQGWASDFQEDVAQLIFDHGCWVSPTVNKGWQRMLDSKSGDVLNRVRRAYRHLLDLGVPMVASTDAGIPGVYHEDLPHALLVFAAIAELSNEATLRTATSDAARALGVLDRTGSLESNKDADVLIVDGDPLTDLSALTRPVHVFARGRALL
jgi:imidazolonepropionase-like amidohydrolase